MGIFGGVFGRYLESKTDPKTPPNLPKTYPVVSTNFLIHGQKRVLPRDSHYFLLAPIAPYKGVCFDLSLTLFHPINLQKTSNTNRKRLQKFSTNFLIGAPKRVLPTDSHDFLLAPINPFKGRNLMDLIWYQKPSKHIKNKQKTTPKVFY